MKKIPKENRIICKCKKCNKPYSYDKHKGWAYGEFCRTCGTKRKDD